MKYEKPALVVLAKAAKAIQGQKGRGQVDSKSNASQPSIAAYEADE